MDLGVPNSPSTPTHRGTRAAPKFSSIISCALDQSLSEQMHQGSLDAFAVCGKIVVAGVGEPAAGMTDGGYSEAPRRANAMYER